jgi:uncharacterized protein (TIGR03086 family)
MELMDAFLAAQSEFGRRVHKIAPGQWDAPTPDSDWSVRDLVGHLVYEELWAPWVLRGATVAEVGDRFDGDNLDGDQVTAWDRAAAEARKAFSRPGALDGEVHLSYGTAPAEEYGWQMVTDRAVHAWDLARAIGDDETIDRALAATLHDRLRPHAKNLHLSGLFAKPVPIPDDADPTARLVALTGRDPR